jgi:hypothetical protein
MEMSQKKPPCIAISNKQEHLFFFFKNGEQEGKNGSCLGVGISGRGGGYKERVKEGECGGNIT